MERRDVLKVLTGTPIAVGNMAVAMAVPSVLTLSPAAVAIDMKIFDDGQGVRFVLCLYEKPWPVVGDVIQFSYKEFSLLGEVTAWETESVHGSQRVKYQVSGKVRAWQAAPVFERDV